MKLTKEMIEAVEYMAESGKCDKVTECGICPFLAKTLDDLELCWKVGYRSKHKDPDEFDKTLQTSAKNWLKENGVSDD